MFLDHRQHTFLMQGQMNPLYVAVFLMHLAESMISIFVPIYLFHLHYSMAQIIFFFLLSSLGSVLFALPVAKVISHIGSAYAILLSTLFLIAYYAGLRLLPEAPWLFFILPIILSGRTLFFNIGSDLQFVQRAVRHKVGSAISRLFILVLMSEVLSPLLAGFIIAGVGYPVLFIIGVFVLLTATIPLLFTKATEPRMRFSWGEFFLVVTKRQFVPQAVSFGGYAIESIIGRTIWPVFLLVLVGAVEIVGAIVALSAFVTVVVLAVAGRLTDRFKTNRLLRFGTLLYFFGWLGSAFVNSTLPAMLADSYRKASERFLLVPWAAAFYRSLNGANYFYAVVARDIMFNLPRVLFLPLLMVVFEFGRYPFVTAFLLAALFTLLYPLAGRGLAVPLKNVKG